MGAQMIPFPPPSFSSCPAPPWRGVNLEGGVHLIPVTSDNMAPTLNPGDGVLVCRKLVSRKKLDYPIPSTGALCYPD